MTEFVNDNGERLEYSGDDITFTKQIASFREFKIKGDFSISFRLANNSQNRKALGYYNIQQIGNHAFAENPFSLIRNGNFDKKGFIIIEDDTGPGGEIGAYFIAGNANWFKAFEFPLNKIENSSLNVQWNSTQIVATTGKTYGIIFPFIDYFFYRNRFGNHWATGFLRGVGDPNFVGMAELYPCLYIHTLVQELAKTANIRISGNLLDDQLYKSLIMTPEGPDLVDTFGNILVNSNGTVAGSTIPISAIPDKDIKAIDFIKWLCFSFGCIPTFDEFTQTLSLNFLDKIKKEDAEDWSDYFQSYQGKYSDFFENNQINVKKAVEDEIVTYNKVNLIPFGEINIRTKKDDDSETTLYSSPFAPVMDNIGTSALKWATPFVQFGKLKDDKSFAYTSVTNAGPNAQFHGVFTNAPDVGGLGAIIRIEDSAGIYTGYHVTSSINAIGSGTIDSVEDFISNSSGTIYFQKLTKQSSGNRILICIPSIPVNNMTSLTNINFVTLGAVQTSLPTAYFSKPNTYPYGNLNNYQKALTYGEINSPYYNDISLTEAYWNKIRAFLLNPPLYGYFILPEAVFAAYKFDTFIFIRNEKLTGYFFIEMIESYKDSVTIVRATMNYVDGYSALTGYNTIGQKAGYPAIDDTGNATGYDPTTDYDKFDTEVLNQVTITSASLGAQLASVFGASTYTLQWSDPPSEPIAGWPMTVPSTFGATAAMDTGTTFVPVTITKTNNGGNSQGATTIQLKINGLVVETKTFSIGNPINFIYNFGPFSADAPLCEVIINEAV